MLKKVFVSLIGMVILSVNAQTVNLQGVVSNSKGEPIANAIVTAVKLKMSDTTGADGRFSFASTSTRKVLSILPPSTNISLKNNVLQFALSTPSPMKVQIFNLKGSLLRQEMKQNAATGTYSLDLSNFYQSANVLLVKAAIGNSEETFRCMPLSDGGYALHRSNIVTTNSNSQRFTAVDEVVDTLIVTATGYRTKSVAITSLSDQDIKITLKANDEKNDPTPSCGCGKELGTINRSGRYNITSAGRNRSYIIDIPSNYNKDTPYRLIFGMHCMGGSADKVAGNSDQSANFYGVKTQANKDGIPCIYVAPQGNDNGTWGGDYEHTFFSDMLNLFKENLCIDTSRVFSIGFSFGAMYTYSLSLSFQNELRAVGCNAPANYNIWLPTNKKLPLAYIQTTGTRDGTCPFDQGGRGGKYCLLGHAEDNGCNTNTEIKLANSGTPVITEFEGCEEGYPVRFMSHNGEHWCNVNQQGSDMVAVEFWNFFKRF